MGWRVPGWNGLVRKLLPFALLTLLCFQFLSRQRIPQESSRSNPFAGLEDDCCSSPLSPTGGRLYLPAPPTLDDLYNPECRRFDGSVKADYFLNYTAAARPFPAWQPPGALHPARYHFAVMTAPKRYLNRRAIRDTWMKTATQSTCGSDAATVRFYLGQTADYLTAHRLMEEFRQYPHDMVFIRFCDVYENLPLKTYNVFHLLNHSLPESAEWIVKIDDDVLPNLSLLQDCFPPLVTAAGPVALFGNVGFNHTTEEKWDTRYIIPRGRYNRTHFPDFAHGPSYLVGRSALAGLLTAADHSALINLEDVWWTGIVAQAAGLRLRNVHRFLLGGKNVWKEFATGNYHTDKAVWFYHGVGPKLLNKYWPNVTQCCGCFRRHCWIYQALRNY